MKKLLIILCSVCMAVCSLFIGSRQFVYASTDTTSPTISGLAEQIDDEYQVGKELAIDKTAIELGDDVTGYNDLFATLTLKVLTAADTELPNISEDENFYMFEFSVAGTYTLNASVLDAAGNEGTYTHTITVISNSAVNKKYEKGFALGVTDFVDSKLYAALLDEVTKFAETRGERFTGDTLYSEMLLFPTFTELDITNRNITSLDGLENLRLDYLQKISVVGNKLTEIKPDYFRDCENLKEINFASNQITSVTLMPKEDDPSKQKFEHRYENLERLNLSSNLLKALDLSGCSCGDIEINLAANDFTSLDDIELPRADSVALNMIANNLESVDDDYFAENKFSLNVGVQGIKESATTDSTKGFRYYRTNIENLGIKIYNVAQKVPTVVKTVSDADITSGNYIDVVLPIGEYKYEYTLDGEEIYSKYDATKNFYLPQNFVVKPTMATYKFEHKGEMYDTIGKVTGAVKVYLKSSDLDLGVDGKIMYSVNRGEWIEGDVVDCSNGGTFSIKVKVVCGDYESDEETILLQTSLNAVIPDVVMFFLILFLAIMLFAVGVPIISKKFFRK